MASTSEVIDAAARAAIRDYGFQDTGDGRLLRWVGTEQEWITTLSSSEEFQVIPDQEDRDSGEMFTPSGMRETWSGKVHAVLDPWSSLPQAGDFSGRLEALQRAAAILRPEAGGGGSGSYAAQGIAQDQLQDALSNLEDQSSLTVNEFAQTYLDTTSETLGYYYGALGIATRALAAEQEAWRRAPDDLDGIKTAAKNAFDASNQIGNSTGDLGALLTVAGAVVAITAVIPPLAGASGAVATAIGAANGVLELWPDESADPAPVAKLGGSSPEQVLDQLSDVLEPLGDRIGDVESTSDGRVTKAAGMIAEVRARPEPRTYDDLIQTDPGEIKQNPKVFKVTQVQMPVVIGSLRTAAGIIGADDPPTPWQDGRPPDAGLSPQGHHTNYWALNDELQQRLLIIAGELERATEILDGTGREFLQLDEDDRAEYETLRKRLERELRAPAQGG